MSGLGQFGTERDLMVEVQLVVQGMVLEGCSRKGWDPGLSQRNRCTCEAWGEHELLLQDLFPHSGGGLGVAGGLPWQTCRARSLRDSRQDAWVAGLTGSVSLHCGYFSSHGSQCGPCWERPLPWAGCMERRGAERLRGWSGVAGDLLSPLSHGSSRACRATGPVLRMCGPVDGGLEPTSGFY